MPTNPMEAHEKQLSEAMAKLSESCTYADHMKMQEQANGIDSPYVLISREKLNEIIDTLAHSQVFISSCQKMHPTGQDLHERILESLRGKLRYK